MHSVVEQYLRLASAAVSIVTPLIVCIKGSDIAIFSKLRDPENTLMWLRSAHAPSSGMHHILSLFRMQG